MQPSVHNPVTLGPHDIHVWYIDLALPASDVTLSPDEEERARRFHFERDRMRFVAAHSAWRHILSAYLDTPPNALRFGEESLGKPFIVQPSTRLRFNASHSADVAAIAIAADGEVGIDLEVPERRITDLDAVAERCFTEGERQELAATTGNERHLRFLRCWTRKEAYVKAIGKGLHVPLDSVHVSSEDHRVEVAAGWVVLPLAPGPRAIAALAVPSTKEWVVRERWWA